MTEKINYILDTTRDFILEVGIDGVSMGKIAKRANVPVSNLYYWFENKNDLINQTYMRSRNKLIPKKVMMSQSDVVGDMKKYFVAYIKNAMNFHNDHMLIEHLYLLPIINKDSKLHTGTSFVALKELTEMGLLKQMDSEILGMSVVGIVNKVVISKVMNNNMLSEEEIEGLALICWDAIKA